MSDWFNEGKQIGAALQQGDDATFARSIDRPTAQLKLTDLERETARRYALQDADAQGGSDLVDASTPAANGVYPAGIPNPAASVNVRAVPAPAAGLPAPAPAAAPVAGAGRGVVNPPFVNSVGIRPELAASAAAAQANSVYTPDSVREMDAEAAAEKNPAIRSRLQAKADAVRAQLPAGVPPSPITPPPAPVVAGDAAAPDAPATGLPTEDGPRLSTRGDALRYLAKAHFKSGASGDGFKHLQAAKDADFEDAVNEGINHPNFHPADAMVTANGAPGAPAQVPGSPHLSIGVVNGPKDGIGSTAVRNSHGADTQYAITTIDPSGQGYTFMANENVMRQINGLTNAMKVDPSRALQGLAQIDTHLAALFATKLEQSLKVQQGNTATAFDSQHGEALLTHAEAIKDRNDIDKRASSMGPVSWMRDENGELVGTQQVRASDGSVSTQVVPVPKGLRPVKDADPAAIQKFADSLVGTPVQTPDGQPVMVNGKPTKYTALTAYQAATSAMRDDRGHVPGPGFAVPKGVTPAAAAAAGSNKGTGIPVNQEALDERKKIDALDAAEREKKKFADDKQLEQDARAQGFERP